MCVVAGAVPRGGMVNGPEDRQLWDAEGPPDLGPEDPPGLWDGKTGTDGS